MPKTRVSNKGVTGEEAVALECYRGWLMTQLWPVCLWGWSSHSLQAGGQGGGRKMGETAGLLHRRQRQPEQTDQKLLPSGRMIIGLCPPADGRGTLDGRGSSGRDGLRKVLSIGYVRI